MPQAKAYCDTLWWARLRIIQFDLSRSGSSVPEVASQLTPFQRSASHDDQTYIARAQLNVVTPRLRCWRFQAVECGMRWPRFVIGGDAMRFFQTYSPPTLVCFSSAATIKQGILFDVHRRRSHGQRRALVDIVIDRIFGDTTSHKIRHWVSLFVGENERLLICVINRQTPAPALFKALSLFRRRNIVLSTFSYFQDYWNNVV